MDSPDADAFLEILHTSRAMRRLKPDPVPDELLRRVVEAATWAPNASNHQTWFFGIIRDREKIARIGALYKETWNSPGVRAYRAARLDPRVERSSDRGAETFGQAPALVVAGTTDPVAPAPAGRAWGASLYPAVQNLLLAARALGLGGYLTTLLNSRQDELRPLLGLPPEATVGAIVPLGYPAGRRGPVRRRPLEEVVFWDVWGNPA
jgi:nitroreductase